MNETMNSIMSRRSVRAFAPEQISEQELAEIIKSGEYAATARGLQPRHFTVVQNKDFIDKLTSKAKEELSKLDDPFYIERLKNPAFTIFHGAPTVIIASAEKNAPLAPIDCACSIQNMAVAATSMGLGSCVIASVMIAFRGPDGPALEKELGIPENFSPSLAISLGYVKDGFKLPEPAPRRANMVNYIK